MNSCTFLNHDLRNDVPCPSDPAYDLPAPLLFAHRGGAREVPESTIWAFEYAKELGTDVLELDVRLTRDHKFIVWHGPSLDNVLIDGQPTCPCRRTRREVGEYYWRELKHRAWVADPPYRADPACAEGGCDLADVPKSADRQLVRLEKFLRLFPCASLNVEIKDFVISPAAIDRFAEILERAPACDEAGRKRVIMVASADDLVLQDFRRRTAGRYETNIALIEALLPPPFIPRLWFKANRALQVPRWRIASSSWAVENLHKAGAAVHVFITKFLWTPGLDEAPSQVAQRDIDSLLDRGIDGVMTDRPCEVRPLIDVWMRRRGCTVSGHDLSSCQRRLDRRRVQPPPRTCNCNPD